MIIWIFNPFDELPGDVDIRHRYWSLAATLAERGHGVTWWSSDWSHRNKRRRDGSDVCDLGFALRLIATQPYYRNVSFARLRNHRDYAEGILTAAHQGIANGTLPPPDRIVCSLPPLGSPIAALELRKVYGCEVILDYMDAWPETFYRVLPGPQWLKAALGRILFAPLHRSAHRAIRGADRISSVSEIYLSLARSITPDKPTHLCYHGIDHIKSLSLSGSLSGLGPSIGAFKEGSPRPDPDSASDLMGDLLAPSPLGSVDFDLKLVYIGALELSYDLATAIRALDEINSGSGNGMQVVLHIAGAGAQEDAIRQAAATRPWLQFDGLLRRDDLHALLSRCHAGLIPMRQDSWVGLPYKVADYCAAGLAVISSLDGECRRLLDTKKAGLYYEPGSIESLKAQLVELQRHPDTTLAMGMNARELAQSTFDRAITYPRLAEFVEG